MNSIKNGFFLRVLSSGLGIAFAINSLNKFSSSSNYGDLILGLAWLLMAAAWFMQPVSLKANLKISEILKAQSAYAIGSPLVILFFSLGGAVLIMIALALKLVNAI